MGSPWLDEVKEFKGAGFSDTEIGEEQLRVKREMLDAGFSGQEADEYFGIKEPDMAPVKQLFKSNLEKSAAEKAVMANDPTKPKQEHADTFIEALEAGWQMSVTGLIGRGQKPDMVLPENADMFYRIASQVGTVAGDIPAMIAGAIGGGAAGTAAGGVAGSAVPVVGNIVGAGVGGLVGAGAGGNALPTAIRETLMQHYEKGDIQDFGDFWERASAVFVETAKSGLVGAATVGVGGVVGKVAAPIASTAARTTAITASEIATMTTVGKALEGQVPSAEDFLEGAIVVGGLSGSVRVASRLRGRFAKEGLNPSELALETQANHILKQELLVDGPDTAPKPKEVPGSIVPVEGKVLPVEGKIDTNLEAQAKIDVGDAPTKAEVLAAEGVKAEPQTPQEKILSQIGEAKDAPKKGYRFNDFYKDFVDKLDPLHRAVKTLGKDPEALAAVENPYKLARMANDYKGKVRYMIEKGVMDYATLETTGKPLKEIIEPFKSDASGLNAYIVSKRVIELEGRGIKSGFDLEAAKSTVSEGKTKFETASTELVEFQNGVLKYLQDSGMISEKSAKAMKEANKNYVSFKRIQEDSQIKGGGSKASPIKKIKGSDLKIQDPITSIMENTETYVRLAEQNKAIESFVKLAEKTPDQTVIEKVPGKQKAIEVKSEEIAKALKDQGFEIEGDVDGFNIFRGQSKDLAPNEFEVYRGGKREVYKTNDPQVAEAIRSLDAEPTATNIIFRLARGITNVKRIGISFTPDFIMRNVFRDQMTSGVFSKGGGIPFTDMIGAMGDIVSKNDTYYSWLKSGGANSTFFDLNKSYLEKDIFKLNKESGNFIDATWNVVKTPAHYLKVASELAEQSSRLAEFKNVTKGKTDAKTLQEGGFASREITVDFQRMGAKMSALNSITAFQNVSIQGLDRTIRAMKEDPKGVAIKAGTYITAPSLLLWYANKDDPRYQEIPRWQKDLFWIIPTDDWQVGTPEEASSLPEYMVRNSEKGIEINKGHVYRLPKPQELGIMFGSLPERVMEAFFQDNPKAMKDFEDTVAELITPAITPDAITPAIEQLFNQSMFTGNNIVPQHLEGLMPQYQYTEYTSESAKILGKMIQVVPGLKDVGPDSSTLASPMVIENYVRGWSGTLGGYALQAADKLLTKSGAVRDPNKPDAVLADIPFVKAFVVRYPGAGAQSIQDFYNRFQESERVMKSVKHLAKQGDFDNMEKELMMEQNQDKLNNLSGIKDALTNQKQMIQMIYINPDINPTEKRQMIDGLYYGMIETAKAGNQLVQEFSKALKENKEE